MGRRAIGVVLGAVVTVGLVFTGVNPLTAATVGFSLTRAVSGRRPLSAKQGAVLSNGVSEQGVIGPIYGRTLTGLPLADVRTAPGDNNTLYVVGAICLGSENGSGIEDVNAIYFDGKQVVFTPNVTGAMTSDGVSEVLEDEDDNPTLAYAIHLGTDAQAVDAELSSIFGAGAWPATSDGAGIAYTVIRLTYDADVYPSGMPTITLDVSGAKTYDPRSTLTAYSNNPALAVLDYLTSTKYGCGIPLAEIDTDSFEDAANYCDEVINTTGYNGKRFIVSGVVDTSQPREAVLADLLTSCRAELVYDAGLYRIIIRRPQAATTFELNEDNLVGDWDFVRSSEVPNSVTARYVDPSAQYQVRELTWPAADQVNGFLTADNDLPSNSKIELPYTPNRSIVEQIAMVLLREAREDLTIAVTAKEAALQLHYGDVVPLTHSTPGFTSKEFWVAGMALLPDATVRLVLREYSAAAYTLDTQDTTSEPPGSDLPSPFDDVPAPTNLVLTSDASTALATQDGQFVPRIRVEWTAADYPFVDFYEIEYKKAADSEWLSAGTTRRSSTVTFIGPVTNGVLYDVRVRAISTLSKASPWLAGQITPGTQPGDPQAGNFVIIRRLRWEPQPPFNTGLGFSIIRFFLRLDAQFGTDTAALRVRYTPPSGAQQDYQIDVSGETSRSVDVLLNGFAWRDAADAVTVEVWPISTDAVQGEVRTAIAASIDDSGDVGIRIKEGDDVLSAGFALMGTGLSAEFNADGNLEITASGVGALGDVTDVVITDPQTNDALVFNGTNWVNAPAGGGGAVTLNDLTNVTISSPADNELLAYHAATSTWINQTPTEAGLDARYPQKAGAETISGAWNFTTAPTINGNAIRTTNQFIPLTSLDPTGATMGQIIRFSGAQWVGGNIQGSDIEGPLLIEDVSGTLAEAHGGTGHNTYALGDILYADGAASLARLAGGSANQFLQWNASLNRPQWNAASVGWGSITSVPVALTTVGTNGQYMRSNGSVMFWDTLDQADIPNLAASKITSGVFDETRIPDLDASKITSGTFATAQIPDLNASKITSGVFAAARISEASVTQHEDALSIDEPQISGIIPVSKGGFGFSLWFKGEIPYASATNVLGKISVGSSSTDVLKWNDSLGIPQWGTVTVGWGQITSIPAALGAVGANGTFMRSDGSVMFWDAIAAADIGAAAAVHTHSNISVLTGTGLTGGGNLSASRTLSVDSTVARRDAANTFIGSNTFNGGVRINIPAADRDFIIDDPASNPRFFIYRDFSAGALYLGGGEATVTLRTDLNLNGWELTGGPLTVDGVTVQLTTDQIALSRLPYSSHPMGWVIRANGSTWVAAEPQFSDLGGSLSAEAITGGTLAENVGGTGHNSYALGDLLYADGVASLARLAGGSANQFLQWNAGLNRPQWNNVSIGWGAITSIPTALTAVGSNGQFMRSNGSVMFWDTLGLDDLPNGVATLSGLNVFTNQQRITDDGLAFLQDSHLVATGIAALRIGLSNNVGAILVSTQIPMAGQTMFYVKVAVYHFSNDGVGPTSRGISYIYVSGYAQNGGEVIQPAWWCEGNWSPSGVQTMVDGSGNLCIAIGAVGDRHDHPHIWVVEAQSGHSGSDNPEYLRGWAISLAADITTGYTGVVQHPYENQGARLDRAGTWSALQEFSVRPTVAGVDVQLTTDPIALSRLPYSSHPMGYVIRANGSTWAAAELQFSDVGGSLSADVITAGLLAEARGGTGHGTYAHGDLLYADGTSSLARLAGGAAGQFLQWNNSVNRPQWNDPSVGWGQITSLPTALGTVGADGQYMRSNGSVMYWDTLDQADIPNLNTSKITAGTFANARISQGNVTQHQAALALAASQITSGTFASGRISQASVTQHQAALAIAASQVTAGTYPSGVYTIPDNLRVGRSGVTPSAPGSLAVFYTNDNPFVSFHALNGDRNGYLQITPSGAALYLAGSGPMSFYTAAAERVQIGATGIVRVFQTLNVDGFVRAGAAVTPSLAGQVALIGTTSSPFASFHNSSGVRVGYLQMANTGATLMVDVNQELRFGTNGATRVTIAANGAITTAGNTINGQTISGAAHFTGTLNAEGGITEAGVAVAKVIVSPSSPSGTAPEHTIWIQT